MVLTELARGLARSAHRIFTALPVVAMVEVATESLFTSETLEKPTGTGKPNPLVEILFSPERPHLRQAPNAKSIIPANRTSARVSSLIRVE